MVIGSQIPWLEAILLWQGAEKITTVDYEKIECDHPKIETITPLELAEQYRAGKAEEYDAVVTFSSVEHSGLGRYGDMLNPWGDLMTMARAWCLAKEGAMALVGVPVAQDEVVYNEGRLYGPLQLAHLFANWEVVHTEVDTKVFGRKCDACFSYQPWHVLRKAGKKNEEQP